MTTTATTPADRASRPPLLLVSNAPIPLDVAAGETPRLDYRELAAALGDAPLSFTLPKRGPMAALERVTASDLRQALDAFRNRARYSAFVSLSEKVALPLALLLGRNAGPNRIPHILLAHHLTSARKRSLQRWTGYLRRFDRIVVFCRAQERYLIDEAGVPPDRVRFVEYMVDRQFWRQDVAASGETAAQTVLAVGREQRDYATLNRAARLVPHVAFTVVASSPWARGGGDTGDERPAENVAFRRNLPYDELRQLYANAGAVVVPLLEGTSYAAGVNGVLEAMAMAKAPIVTQTPGIIDYIEDGVTGTLVAPNDPVALGSAIEASLMRPEEAAVRGVAARAVVDEGRNMETYIANLAQIVREVRDVR